MKGINKKLGEPIPKGYNAVFKGESICLDVTLSAKMEGFLLPILSYNALIDTIRTKAIIATGTIPLCRFGGMIFTDRFHGQVPFLCVTRND